MSRKVALLIWLTVFALLFLLGRSAATQAAPSATPICGAINSNATWTTAGNPYQVCAASATVSPGVTLNIQPGVIVEFAADSKLTSRGTLNALGTITQPITFTGVTATPGSWRGLVVESLVATPTVATLDHVVFQYGGLATYSGAQIYADIAVVTVTNSLLTSGAGNGLYGSDEARLTVRDTQILNQGQDAMRLSQPQGVLDLDGLTATGNGRNVIFVDGTTYLAGEHVWPAAGIPYLINAVFGNLPGDSLTIAPGTVLRFTPGGWMNIRGELKAIGLPTAPITFTGDLPVPGSWRGLELFGLTVPARAQLDYVTVEYGGANSSGANVLVYYGALVARNSIIRLSQRDGVRFDTGGTGSMMNSQIVNNVQYGVRNVILERQVLAANNWWGDPLGPTADVVGCSPGSGDKVTGGVIFRPVLTSTTAVEFPLVDGPQISITPRRWFAPADGLSRVYFDITVRDGDGQPLPGRVVDLSTSLGAAVDGGTTDANGHTLAYLTAASPGEAEVVAALASTGCEGALSPTSRVTFTPPFNVIDLFPEAQSPYMNGALSISPLPVIVGISTTITAQLTNPLTVPITVDVAFGYVQASVGLAFGPIEEITGLVIPPQTTVPVSTTFLPPVSGHYCVEVTYSVTDAGGLALPSGTGGRSQLNLNAFPGGTAPPSDKDSLEKSDKMFNLVSKLSPRGTNIQKAMVGQGWNTARDTSATISQQLGFDPPRQDYNQITLPISVTLPAVVPDGNISPARAAAANEVSHHLELIIAYGRAATVALDRLAGATQAQDGEWAAKQAAARLEYEQQLGAALLNYADSLEDFVQLLVDEAETEVTVTVSEVISYQQDLANTGFTPPEIAAAHQLGVTDAEIEAFRQEIIAANPNELAGNILDMYTEEAAVSRELGLALLTSNTYRPGFSVSGGAGLQPSAVVSNTMAQIENTTATFVVGNPLSTTALIELRPRRIDLPADWIVSVTPSQVTLAPGEQTTVTVTVLTGSLVPQRATPRLAVEGYIGSELIGGVAIDIGVPAYTERFDTYNLFLSLLFR